MLTRSMALALISVAMLVIAGCSGNSDGDAANRSGESKSRFDVVITGYGDSKILVIKTVREVTGLGLKEAIELVESVPKPLKTGISLDDATEIKDAIESAGGTAEIR